MRQKEGEEGKRDDEEERDEVNEGWKRKGGSRSERRNKQRG